ncbi:hypothetical protein ACLRGF_05555 [Mycetocola zhadangensis]|uniref:hypothetical protein n=1 Tax=Mycetocola zhadangensis TaxID=1164595 RepID=UPI003A4D7CF8
MASVAVIIIALVFAFNYHAKILNVISMAVANGQKVEPSSDDAVIQGAETSIFGPEVGVPSAKLEFVVVGVDAGLLVSWIAEGGAPASDEGMSFVTLFEKAGDYKVTATYTDADGSTHSLEKTVAIAAPAPAPAAAAIALPFVIKNWGRLVIVLFGVGVVSALMSAKILDAAAGVGILGVLLGVGAVTATSGTGGDKPTLPED